MASYVDSNLGAGEEVICRANISWFSVLLPLILGAFLLIFYGLGLLILIPCILKIMTTELALTNKRVIAKFGVISRHTVELRLEKIESININQGVFGRIFNYGSVVVNGTGGTGTPIPNIGKPLDFRKQINDYLEDHQKQA
ncbi:MAG: PH domain-containing protein [Candidatus Adiutrix sp.]|nr:PH domain-containing protein [Candidatus Adiutrix sp.]